MLLMKGREFGSGGPGQLSAESTMTVVGGGKRLEIIELLAAGPSDVGTIAARLELAVTSISHHLSILKRFGLVTCEADGVRRLYGLSKRITARRRRGILRVRIRLTPQNWITLNLHRAHPQH